MASSKAYPPKDKEELRKILDEVARTNTVISLMLELMALTGFRYSDCSELRFSDVMINNGIRDRVTVIQKKPHSKRLSAGASPSVAKAMSQIDVPIGTQASKVIVEALELSEGSKLLFASHKNHDKPYTCQYVNRLLKAVASKLGLKYQLTTHSFRKAFALMLLENGANIHELRDKLGHSSIAVTDHYLRTFLSESDQFVSDIKF